MSGGTGIAFADDGNGVDGEAADTNSVAAADAHLTVNNLPVTSDTNVLADVSGGG